MLLIKSTTLAVQADAIDPYKEKLKNTSKSDLLAICLHNKVQLRCYILKAPKLSKLDLKKSLKMFQVASTCNIQNSTLAIFRKKMLVSNMNIKVKKKQAAIHATCKTVHWQCFKQPLFDMKVMNKFHLNAKP